MEAKDVKLKFCSCIGGIKLKTCNNNGDFMSSVSHETTVRPKERAVAILAQVNREMAGSKSTNTIGKTEWR